MMVDIQTVSIVLAGTGVTIAAAYYIVHLWNQTRLRQTDLIMRIFSHFGSREYQEPWQKVMSSEYKDYHDFVEKCGLAEMYQVVMLFEGVGTLLHMRLLNIELVQHLIHGPIIATWEKMKPVIEGHRQNVNQPQFCEWFEYLYNEMKKRQQKLQKSKA